jgi:aspartate aminotransferase
VADAIKNFNIEVLEYSHSAGFESYRTKLSQFYKNQGLPIDVEDIIISTGGSDVTFRHGKYNGSWR